MAKIVNDIEIVERIYDPHMDLYAVFGRAVEAHPAPFVLAWQKRGKTKLRDIERFADWKTAKDAFNDAVTGDHFPKSKKFYNDDQQQKVYAWEYMCVEPYAQKLNKREARALVKAVSKDYGMKSPKVTFTKNGDTSTYAPNDHAIELREHDNITVLHELAHAIHNKENERSGRDHIHHAPQFVWLAIELYQRYAGLDMQEMVISAYQNNLLGDLSATHFLEAKEIRFNPEPH